ncbi:MAG: hypothetical protein M3O35_02975 [Acidobacteriota bacterium]|nr:hypothetical protein [Acidobacteriota bacterium]
MKSINSKLTLTLLCTALAGLGGPGAPNADTLKQVLNKKLQSLRPDGTTERNVLFQDVRAGGGTGGFYSFQVTALIRDYGPGYPRNRYYGETCVGRLDKVEYTLMRNNFGEWQVEGAMTPSLATRQCKPNPADGVSSIPLATLSGSAAPAGEPAAAPVAPAANPGAGSGGGVAAGSYECWANGQARMLLNFTIRTPGQYIGSDGKPGAYSLGAGGRITFHGGALDGVLPAGFYTVYYSPQGRPTVSFRNSGGSEVSFCQKVR